jgi:hypothetical protein
MRLLLNIKQHLQANSRLILINQTKSNKTNAKRALFSRHSGLFQFPNIKILINQAMALQWGIPFQVSWTISAKLQEPKRNIFNTNI